MPSCVNDFRLWKPNRRAGPEQPRAYYAVLGCLPDQNLALPNAGTSFNVRTPWRRRYQCRASGTESGATRLPIRPRLPTT